MRDISYQMSRKQFNELLKTRNEEEKKMNPYAFVAKILNENNGLLGEVKVVTVV